MELRVKRVKVKSTEQLLMPVGDIQYAGPESSTDLPRLKRHIAWGVKHDARFIGLADYVDFASPSNRMRLKQAALYDSAVNVLDNAAAELVDELYEEALEPSTGMWLGLLEGHHFYQFEGGATTDTRLCKLLKADFLGTSAIIRLILETEMGECPIEILATHGTGFSVRLGGPLNKIENWMAGFPTADIVLMGHTHKVVGAPMDALVPVWTDGPPRLVHRTRVLASTGGFSRGYMVGHKVGRLPRGTYVEQRMYPPTSLGGPVIIISPRKEGGAWIPDIRLSQ